MYNVKANDGTLEFESASILEKFSKLQFLDKSIVAEGKLLGKDGNLSEVCFGMGYLTFMRLTSQLNDRGNPSSNRPK